MSDEILDVLVFNNDPDVGDRHPFHLVTEDDALAFWEKYRLPIEKDVFIRGFLACRHRAKIELKFQQLRRAKQTPKELYIDDHEFTEMELDSLWQLSQRGKWETLCHMSRLHWLLVAGCIFAGITQGWDQAAMAGAAVQAMRSFGRPVDPTISGNNKDNINLDENAWIMGFLVAAPFLAGAPIGLLITDRLTEIWMFGRRGAICAASLFSFISVIGSASVSTLSGFIVFRVLLGAGMVGKASIVPILLSETAPKNVRGILLVFWQLSVSFGLAAGSVANLSVYHLDEEQSWRYMFIAAFIPALVLFSLVLFSPESPRWLLKKSGLKKNSTEMDKERSKQRVRDALKSLMELHNETNYVLAAGELVLLYKRLIEEQDHFPHHFVPNTTRPQLEREIAHVSWKTRWSLMGARGPIRRASYAAAAVMIAQQACGINLLAFLTDNFFRNSFFSIPNSASEQAQVEQNQKLLYFSMGYGIWNFLSTIPALFFIDNSNDRRKLLNWSFPCMAVSLLISGLILLAPKSEGQVRPVVAAMHYIFIAIFTTAYSIGEGPSAFVISAEVFPLVNRELGMSLAVFWNFLGAGLLALLVPALTKAISQVGVLGLFSGNNLLAWAFCYWLVPNTGNEELEDVLRQFNAPTKFSFIYTGAYLWNKVRYDRTCPSLELEWEEFERKIGSDLRMKTIWRFLRRSSDVELGNRR